MNNTIIIVASLAFVFTAVNQVISLPAGIRTILNEQVPNPLLLALHTVSFLMYAGWCIYGFLRSDPAMVIGCCLGMICSLALLTFAVWSKYNKSNFEKKYFLNLDKSRSSL